MARRASHETSSGPWSRSASCCVRSRSKSLGSNRGDSSISASRSSVGIQVPGQDADADARCRRARAHPDRRRQAARRPRPARSPCASSVPWSSSLAVRCARPYFPCGIVAGARRGLRSDTCTSGNVFHVRDPEVDPVGELPADVMRRHGSQSDFAGPGSFDQSGPGAGGRVSWTVPPGPYAGFGPTGAGSVLVSPGLTGRTSSFTLASVEVLRAQRAGRRRE